MSRVTASIPDSTKLMVGSIFKREHIRSITVYFGIGEERPFYIEKTPSLLMERLKHNITFFYLNYVIITAMLFCLTLLTSPTTIIGMALLAGIWFWLIRSSAATGYVEVSGMYQTPKIQDRPKVGTFLFSRVGYKYLFMLTCVPSFLSHSSPKRKKLCLYVHCFAKYCVFEKKN